MCRLALILHLFLFFGCGQPQGGPVAPEPVSPPPGPTAADLRKLDFVHSVAVHEATGQPTHRIIHLLNWHFVEQEDFATDLRDTDPDLTDDKIGDRHDELIASVEAVQAEQGRFLQHLIEHHGLQGVYLEGLSNDLLPDLKQHVQMLRNFETNKPDGDSGLELLMLEEYHFDRLRLGAAGQLHLEGTLEELLPAEDGAAYEAANPVREDGTVVFDDHTNEAREDAIVRHLLEGGPVAVVVLGGDHDLSDNAEGLSDGRCEVLRVKMNAYHEAAE